MSNIYNLADTWNAIGTTFNSIRMDVSNGAGSAAVGAAASRVLNLLNNGVSKFATDINGCLYQPQPSAAQRNIQRTSPFDGRPDFTQNVTSYLWPGDARYNQVMRFGWNCFETTSPDWVSGQASVGVSFESYYYINALSKAFSEGYFEYTSPNGATILRPFGFRTAQDTNQTDASIQFTTLAFLDDSGGSLGGMNAAAASVRFFMLGSGNFPTIMQLRNTSASTSAGWRWQIPGTGGRNGDFETLREDGNFAFSLKATSGLVSMPYGAGIGVAPVTTSYLALGAGTTALSSLRIPSGAAPTSPVNGDIWSDG